MIKVGDMDCHMDLVRVLFITDDSLRILFEDKPSGYHTVRRDSN